DLAAVGGIGQHLLVAGHRGVENHLAKRIRGGAKRLAGKTASVFEGKDGGHGRRRIWTGFTGLTGFFLNWTTQERLPLNPVNPVNPVQKKTPAPCAKKKALWSDHSDQFSKAPFLPHLCRVDEAPVPCGNGRMTAATPLTSN